MDLLLILRDALASSFVGALATALRAKEAGREVGILITQEALAAVVQGSFAWPRELSGQHLRLTMADAGKDMDLPLSSRGEGRQLDVKGLMVKAAEAGVTLYACPIWTSLLNVDGQLPEAVQALKDDALADLIQNAKQIVGTL